MSPFRQLVNNNKEFREELDYALRYSTAPLEEDLQNLEQRYGIQVGVEDFLSQTYDETQHGKFSLVKTVNHESLWISHAG